MADISVFIVWGKILAKTGQIRFTSKYLILFSNWTNLGKVEGGLAKYHTFYMIFLATFPKLVQFENRITYFEVNLIWPRVYPQTIKTDISAISATL